MHNQVDSRVGAPEKERFVTRVGLEPYDAALADPVQRILKSSGDYEVVRTSTLEPAPVAPDAPDVVLLVGSTAPALQRIGELRGTGWGRGLAVAAADTRPETAVACLDAGADDYLRLPLDAKEFLSRIHALARRVNPSAKLAGRLRLDTDAYAAHVGDWRASFKKTSFHLFAYLAERAGHWKRTEELQMNVLQAHCSVGASNVRWHVLEARRALGPMRWCLHSGRAGYMFDMQSCDLAHCKDAR